MSLSVRRLAVAWGCLLILGCAGSEPDAVSKNEQKPVSEEGNDSYPQLEQARALLEEGGDYAQVVAACDEVLAQQSDHAEALLLRAQAHLGLGQTAAAAQDADAAQHAGADQLELTNLRARIAVAEERFAEADRFFTEAIGQDPDNAGLYEERALIRAVMNQHEQAIADFTKGIERDPRAASLYRWRAEEYFTIGRFDDALNDAKNAILLDRDNPDYYLARAHFQAELGLIDPALADYEQALKLVDAPFTHYLRGNLHAAAGNPEAALQDLSTAIEREPERTEYYLARANVQLELGEDALAEADYDKAVEIEPANENARQRRAGFYLSRGRFEPAIADLTAALQRDPGLLSALRLRGIARRQAQQYQPAVEDFQTALDTGADLNDQMRAELLYQQGLTYQAEEQHEEAVQKFEQATQLNGELAEAYFALSMSQGAEGHFEPSKQSLDAAIAADPDNGQYYLARARVQMALAQIEQIVEEKDPTALMKLARADFERAVQVAPEDDSAWYALALSDAAMGSTQQAVSNLTKAIELNPADARYYQTRGDIRLRRQQYATAIEDYSKAIELNSDSQSLQALYQSRSYAYGELGKKAESDQDYQKAEELSAKTPDL